MSKTSRTPYKKNNEKETCERCGEREKQVSGVDTANSLDNCEQTVPLKESLNEEHDKEQLQMSYHAQQGKSDTTENRPRKQTTEDETV